ncbi:glycosyltransferase family 4 protein [Anoxybacillus kestanbolensis]|uniref:glycosyltransferase family 4 protein n=1 Tax=Anoxybacillus kestanbolensis TaxID=227476 RepID=UPI003D194A28
MKYKILIDGYYLAKPRGMGRYVKELLYSLSQTEFAENFKIFVLIPKEDKNCGLVNLPFNYIEAKKLPFPLWEQFLVPYYSLKYDIDLLLSPYNTFPLIGRLFKYRSVVTIHDLMFLDKSNVGGNIYQKLGNLYRKLVVSSIPNKSKIITVSQKSARDIKEYLKRDSQVIYTAVDLFYKENESQLTKNNNIKYVYHVGGVSPHKNTERVIQAFLALQLEDTKLIISGMSKDNPIKAKYKEYNSVVFTGWLEDAEVANLYYNAKAVIFPSLVEGYGLPIIEAFKYGTPVVTSNVEPMNEIAKDAAILVDPYSIDSIQRGILEAVNNEKYREELKYKMKQRLNEINAERMGNKVLGIFYSILSK